MIDGNSTNGVPAVDARAHPVEMEDPICIVGMACHLPGSVRSPSALWKFLTERNSAQGRVPPERFNIDGFYRKDAKNRAGVVQADGGYFLDEDIRNFDNQFFGINNLEAMHMDPQQRKLLEVVYECLEGAGITLEQASGSKTGVFVGNFTLDFQTGQLRDPDYIHRYHATGISPAVMANRISYVFNLLGPSVTLDTACSSSMYALHSALQALRNNECDGAIVASANLFSGLEQHFGTIKGGVVSATSTCHTFDESADGYGRGEAANAIYVKRLSSALRDGDRVRAVIRGTAINADGRTPGITQPSSKAQEAVIRQTYNSAGLSTLDTDYVECHGTGTPVGDPIEVAGVGSAFQRKNGLPLMIGSVKTNFGHSEAASAITSIIKVVLALENGSIPPTYGIKKLNPNLELDSYNMQVVQNEQRWPRAIRRAGVNSFGFGGANGHAVLESYETFLGGHERRKVNGVHPRLSPALLLVSAASKPALEVRINHVTEAMQSHVMDVEYLDDLAFTMAKRRTRHKHRAYLIASSHGDNPGVKFQEPAPVAVADEQSSTLPFVYVCTGQGAQHPGMSKELFHGNMAFASTIRKLDKVLQGLPKPPSWTLEQTITDTAIADQVHHVTRSQPMCTAVQVAIIDMLSSWGIQPVATVGHSSGEIAAAYALRLMTAEQAIITAYYRGYAVEKMSTTGRMMAVGASSDDVDALIREKGLENEARVGCVNSPKSVTVSGTTASIESIHEELQARGTFARMLETNGRPYHSHLMEEVGPLYEELLRPIFDDTSPVETPGGKMFSSVGLDEGLAIFETAIPSPARYWRDNLERSVQFGPAMENLAVDFGKVHAVEIGPHSALKGPIDQIRKKLNRNFQDLAYSSTIRRKENSQHCMLELAGNLFQKGHELDWSVINGWDEMSRRPKPVHDLPPYPWDYSGGLLWTEPRATYELRNREYKRHELLGSRQLAGNGIEYNWRNVIQLSEVPWLKDHKVESQIIFPAAGHLCLAIEGLKQILKLGSKDPSINFVFRDVSVPAALVIPDEHHGNGASIEVHTSIWRKKLSALTSSQSWFEFGVSSWADGKATLHCAGNIAAETDPDKSLQSTCTQIEKSEEHEDRSTGPVYKKMDEEGLCYGPTFQSLTTMKTDINKSSTDAIFRTRLTEDGTGASVAEQPYDTHPIVIDACLQAAIVAITAGKISSLKALLPVFISKCSIRPTGIEESGCGGDIHIRSIATSPGTIQSSCTLKSKDGMPVVNIEKARLTLYSGKKSDASGMLEEGGSSWKRNPCLRVSWKPDIQRLGHETEQQLREYISAFVAKQDPDIADSESVAGIAAILDLAGHKNPRVRVLELDSTDCQCGAADWQHLLGKDTPFSRFRSWSNGKIDEGKIQIKNGEKGPFDVVLIPKHSSAVKLWRHASDQLLALVGPHGIIVTRASDDASQSLKASNFQTLNIGRRCLLATPARKPTVTLEKSSVVLVVRSPSAKLSNFAETLATVLRNQYEVDSASIISLQEVEKACLTSQTICISFVEVEKGFLPVMTTEEMDLFRHITNTVKNLLWLTGSDALSNNGKPDLSLSSGLSRALMVEQPTLGFAILDVGQLLVQNSKASAQLLCTNIVRALLPQYPTDDKEFIQKDDMLHISRFVPDTDVNTLFSRRMEPSGGEMPDQIQMTKVKDAFPARLMLGKVGLLSSLYFQEVSEQTSRPPEGFVDVDVKAVSINAKDVYTMYGRVETQESSLSLEFGGVVKAVGANSDLAVGDRVVALAPNHWHTTERVPISSVCKIQRDEDFSTMAALPVVYCTAIYALQNRANLQPGESVLIHAGAGAFGIAAISLALSMGATVYTTAGSASKREFLMEEFGLPESHIFNSRDTSFAKEVMKQTDGEGVDVIVNSLIGDLLHDSWDCIADFGRFVEIGKKDLVDAGKLDMRIFLRNATFTAFDLSELFYNKTQRQSKILKKLMNQALDLYRSGKTRAVPITRFDIGDVVKAYRHFSTEGRIGKIVVSLENPESTIPTIPSKYRTQFSPDKVYLLIGCLGGLGRSLSRWMMSRGARNFVFLGRSGCDKPDAKKLVAGLKDAGAEVHVIRGDVVNADATAAAVKACEATDRPIGGVIQAAMGLSEALFAEMSNKAWHTGIQPKWSGTWNLHNALEHHDLDFFLLTSSVSGSIGNATESNYSAANGFLDSFAQWRSRQGKPTYSVGLGMISEVGYLHENPEIEALVMRRGVRPLTEEEMIQVIDLALTSDFRIPADCNESHLLTGLEPSRFQELLAQGFDVDNETVRDPRTTIALSAVAAQKEAMALGASGDNRTGSATSKGIPAWLRPIAKAAADALVTEADAASLKDAVLRKVARRLSGLILLPMDEIDVRKPIAQYGVDSMLASEFRNWLWSTLKVDVPFLDLTSANKDLTALAEYTETKLPRVDQ